MSAVIVDTGCANLSSVAFAFERLGITPEITYDADKIRSAERVVLPGVGSAKFAIQNLKDRGLVSILKSLNQPVLGICLGMQLLFERSSEGDTDMLGIIPGTIQTLDTGELPSPHMGWNTLDTLSDDPILRDVSPGDHVYFVHSYAAPVVGYTLAQAHYGHAFSAVVRKDNFYGCQFHPERSAKTGAKILKNFLELKA